jgi:hypothetical protein
MYGVELESMCMEVVAYDPGNWPRVFRSEALGVASPPPPSSRAKPCIRELRGTFMFVCHTIRKNCYSRIDPRSTALISFKVITTIRLN